MLSLPLAWLWTLGFVIILPNEDVIVIFTRFIVKLTEKLHTKDFSLLKVTEVQLKRLGGSQPLCSSQWRIAVPEMEVRERERLIT